jgi:hypothetical protein
VRVFVTKIVDDFGRHKQGGCFGVAGGRVPTSKHQRYLLLLLEKTRRLNRCAAYVWRGALTDTPRFWRQRRSDRKLEFGHPIMKPDSNMRL